MADSIRFSANWNNKLDCEVFPTFRLPNNKYKIGQRYRVLLRHEELGMAELIKIRKFAVPLPGDAGNYRYIEGRKYYYLTDSHALLDTGKPLAYLLTLFKKFYPRVDFRHTPVWWLFFRYLDVEQEQPRYVQAEAFPIDFATKLTEL